MSIQSPACTKQSGERSVPMHAGGRSTMTVVQRTLAAMGWTIAYFDLDISSGKPSAEFKLTRSDGRYLWGRIDRLGRCTLEAFHRDTRLRESSYGPMAPRCNISQDTFLWRSRPQTPRALLRDVTCYVADNAREAAALARLRRTCLECLTVSKGSRLKI